MKFSALAVVALFTVMISGCSDEKSAEKSPRPVRAVTVAFEEIGDTIVQIGEIKARSETAMSFRINGQLTFRVDNGEKVKKGETIARIDSTPSSNSVLTAKADLSNAKATLALAEATAERNRSLYAKNVASQAQVQEADANLGVAQARVQAAEAALANAEEQLSYTDLKAERDGIISAVGSNEGQVISAGEMIATLISDDQRDAVFDVPEAVIRQNFDHPLVKVALISDPTITAEGTVRELTPSADPATRTYRVKVGLADNGNRLPFGAAIIGTLISSPKKLAQLPSSALTEDQTKPAVFVFDRAASKLQIRPVTVERYGDSAILVAAGVSDGELVATAGVSKLRNGETATLMQEQKP